MDKLSDGYLGWFPAEIIRYYSKTDKYTVQYTGYPGSFNLSSEHIKIRKDTVLNRQNISLGLKVISSVVPRSKKNPFWYTATIISFDSLNYQVRFDNNLTKKYKFIKEQSFIF